jgi:SAM-dependent methyltransferase
VANVTTTKECRVCGYDFLIQVLSLGNQNIADFVDSPITKKPVVPLNLMFCEHCKLVQLGHTTHPDILFSEFWYRSNINEMMKLALQDIVNKSYEKAKLKEGDLVLDIGCNDGTMLDMFPKTITTVGFDPSNILDTDEARNRMTHAVNTYFNKIDALKISNHFGKRYKLVTAIAMFYDLDDPAGFLQEIKSVMAEDGLLVIQMNYLLSMLRNYAVDNVCHEHLTYFSLTSLRWLLNKVGLEVIDIELNEVNGGSIRVYIKRIPLQKDEVSGDAYERIKNQLDVEKQFQLSKIETYIRFGNEIKDKLKKLMEVITDISIKGNPVYAYGASTRGTVLLQSTQFPLPLAGVAERDSNKFGKYMVANWLKIYSEEYVRERCKFMLILPWHFKEAIVIRESEWLNNGGTLIFPLPKLHMVTKDGETVIENKVAIATN